MTEETIVAVYDSVVHADAAVRDLEAINVPPGAISRHSGEAMSENAGSSAAPREKGFWSSLFGGEPGHDEEIYNHSLKSGSSVVVVKVPDQHVQQVSDVLERHNPIDIDERASGHGTGMGGSTTTTTTTTTGMPAGGAVATGATATGMATGTTAGTSTAATGMHGGEEVLSLSEEQLSVGKRLINRGTTRIRRFVVETPVEEAVTLHSETVSVERRPVTSGARVAEADFTDRTIEVAETEEEAVVAKTAHVKEEVVINKQATDRVETVRDTVRREDVEISKDGTTAAGVGRTAGVTEPHVDPTLPRV